MKQNNKQKKQNFYRFWLLILIVLALFLLFVLFSPFLKEIIISITFATVFYPLYQKLRKFLNHKNLAALMVCLILLLIVIIPISSLVAYGAQKLKTIDKNVVANSLDAEIVNNVISKKVGIEAKDIAVLEDFILEITDKISNWFSSEAAYFVVGTTSFIVSLFIILVTMFFLFIKGEEIVKKLIHLSPLPNEYDLKIANSFKKISQQTIFSAVFAALIQGFLSAIGFLIIGWPFFLMFFISAILSIVPYMLSIFLAPVIIYLLFTVQIWQGLVILIWNFLFAVNIDELIRARLVKGKSQISTVFIFFSILGGLHLFGFWGIFIGPIIISLAATIFHIYELEFAGSLKEK